MKRAKFRYFFKQQSNGLDNSINVSFLFRLAVKTSIVARINKIKRFLKEVPQHVKLKKNKSEKIIRKAGPRPGKTDRTDRTRRAYFKKMTGPIKTRSLAQLNHRERARLFRNIQKKIMKEKANMRKTIMIIVAAGMTLVVALQKQLGLSLDSTSVATAVMLIATYIFGEFKNDVTKLKNGLTTDNKWRDPAFWGALAGPVMVTLNEAAGFNLPVDAVNVVLMGILGLVFKTRNTKAIAESKVLRRL
jgi:hypothetical protein